MLRIKRIVIQGFKTFARKTEFVFDPGVTAVVGPNGSGKSNVADAVRWCLGEQSFGLLRSKKTADVIFSGSDKRARIAIVRFFQPQATKIVGHSDLKPTSCPGNHVRALLRAGAFEPDATDSPTPPAAQRTLQERVEAIEAEIEKLKTR